MLFLQVSFEQDGVVCKTISTTSQVVISGTNSKTIIMSVNWQASTLDKTNVKKVGLDEFIDIYSLISDLCKTLTMLLCVDMNIFLPQL